jgi:dynein heavy chain
VHYERLFLYCLAWSAGGLLPKEERPAFDAQLRTLTQNLPPQVGLRLNP